MGKARGKKKSSEFDDLFLKHPELLDAAPTKGASGGWHTSVSDMAMDDAAGADDQPQAADAGADAAMDVAMQTEKAAKKRKGKKGRAGGGGAGAMSMDMGEGPSKPSLGVKVGSMKRGSRTTHQKKRKAALIEKAVARVEKSAVRVDSKLSKKQLRTGLKHIY